MIWSLQILRFIAALMVVFNHSAQIASTGAGFIPLEIALACLSGVDIFFVISGVVISISARGLSATEFLWQRVRRILPIYWIACIILAFLKIPAGIDFGFREVIATVFLWPATDVMTESLLPIAWTLTFELLFYFCVALVLFDRRWMYVLLGIYALAFWLRPIGPVFQILGNPIVIEFMIGVLIARLPKTRVAVWGIPIGVAALIAAAYLDLSPNKTMPLSGEGNVVRVLVFGLPSALIVYGVMQIEVRRGVWTYLGDMSYALYLFHFLPIWILAKIMQAYPLPANAVVPFALLISVIFSWRMYVLIDLPLLRALPRRLGVARTGLVSRSAVTSARE